MRVLSLFDGMACGYEALLKAWIKVEKYYASEIDKYAIQIAMKNHPDIIQVWDVTKLKGEDFKDVDMIIGGSPCQGFSMAWKMLNFNDPRSKLFFEFVRLVKEIKPKYFLLENVKMKKEFQDVISEYMWVQPIEINSALVSAQNRKRLYRTNIPWVIQPEDKRILLKDILETDVDEKYDLTERQKWLIEFWIQTSWWNIKRIWGAYGQVTRWWVYDTEWQAPTITASMWMWWGHIPMIVRWRPKMPYEPWHRELEYKQYSDKCPTLTENCASGDQKNTVIQPLVSVRGGELRIRQATKQWYIVANEWDGVSLAYPNSTTRRGRVTKQKSNTLMASWDSYVVQKVWDRDKNNRWVHTDKSYCLPANPMSDRWQLVVEPMIAYAPWSREYEQQGWKTEKSPTICARDYKDPKVVATWLRIRKLTPIECERLQTMPDNYTEWVSDTQRYKMLWNWWTCDVIAHIFSFIKTDNG